MKFLRYKRPREVYRSFLSQAPRVKNELNISKKSRSSQRLISKKNDPFRSRNKGSGNQLVGISRTTEKSSCLIVGVEEVPIEEWDDERPDCVEKNLRPSEGNWIEPVEEYMTKKGEEKGIEKEAIKEKTDEQYLLDIKQPLREGGKKGENSQNKTERFKSRKRRMRSVKKTSLMAKVESFHIKKMRLSPVPSKNRKRKRLSMIATIHDKKTDLIAESVDVKKRRLSPISSQQGNNRKRSSISASIDESNIVRRKRKRNIITPFTLNM